MSIERLNHLRFPAVSLPTSESDTSGAQASATKTAQPPRLTARVPTLSERLEPVTASVVVSIQADTLSPAAAPEPVVYGDARKLPQPVSEQADLDRMEAAYQRAQERTAQTVTPLKVDAQGILVERQPDFVSVAVSAMREFKDEAEREKRYASVSLRSDASNSTGYDQTPTAGPLRGLQQFASRLNLFA